MATVFTLGPMEEGTKDNGSMVNNTVKAHIFYKMVQVDSENGSKVKEPDG